MRPTAERCTPTAAWMDTVDLFPSIPISSRAWPCPAKPPTSPARAAALTARANERGLVSDILRLVLHPPYTEARHTVPPQARRNSPSSQSSDARREASRRQE